MLLLLLYLDKGEDELDRREDDFGRARLEQCDQCRDRPIDAEEGVTSKGFVGFIGHLG